MSKLIDSLRSGLDRLLQTVCAVLLVVLTVDVSWQVFSRYVLNSPSSFTDELARFLMIWLGMLGACLLFGKNGHLAITLLPDRLTPSRRRALECAIYLLILAFAAIAMAYGGNILIARTMRQLSPALRVPMGYVYAILPLSAALVGVYMALNIADVLAGRNPRGADRAQG